MNHYQYEELTIGQQESFSVTVTEEMMDLFCRMSGDVSPIHLDEDYARRRGYPGRVCYGMLVAGFISTMAGTYLPGEHCLLHSVQSKFAKPVFIGDELTVTGKVSEKQDLFKEITVKVRIVNQQGVCVCRGEYKAGLAQ